MGGMDCGRIVDAVAEEAGDMAAFSQRVDDALFLIGIDAREKSTCSTFAARPASVSSAISAPVKMLSCASPTALGHMLHDGGLIARDDLELDSERRQIGDRLCGIGFGRIGENAKADKCQVGFVGERQTFLVGRKDRIATPSKRNPCSFRRRCSASSRAPPGFVERMGQAIDLDRYRA